MKAMFVVAINEENNIQVCMMKKDSLKKYVKNKFFVDDAGKHWEPWEWSNMKGIDNLIRSIKQRKAK